MIYKANFYRKRIINNSLDFKINKIRKNTNFKKEVL